MKVFFDMEFTGLHQKTTPISLGIVTEHERTFYAEFTDYDQGQVNEWIQENVINHLTLPPLRKDGREAQFRYQDYPNAVTAKGTREHIAACVRDWLGEFDIVEMWGDVLPYDWILFCELFNAENTAERLPKNVYYIPFDLATLFKLRGIDPDVSREEYSELHGTKHNALHDAKVIKACYEKAIGG